MEEANALIDAAEGEWRAMSVVALRTGFRQGELFGLQWQDVNQAKGFLAVRPSAFRGRVGSPKSNKGCVVPLPERMARRLNEGLNAVCLLADHAYGMDAILPECEATA